MKHLSLPFVVLALILAACSGSSGAAATVNGTDITVDDVAALVGEDGAIPDDVFVSELESLIVSTVALQSAREDFDIDPTEEEVEAQYETFTQQIAQAGGGDYEAGLEAQNLTDARVRQAAREQLVVQQLQTELADGAGEVTDEEVAEALETSPDQYTSACVSHILVETEEEAEAVQERLEAGEEFAEVARDASVEPAAAESGGDLGCGPLAQWVAEFAEGVRTATVGEVTEPVESEFGYHLILVESIDDEATAEEAARAQLGAQQAQQQFIDWVDDALANAEVEVDPEYGTWTTDPQPSIIPADDGEDDEPAGGGTDTTGAPGTTEPPVTEDTAG